MRIAYVADSYPPALGGIQVVVGELARGMASRGHEVEVLVFAGVGEAPGSTQQDGVLVRRFAQLIPNRRFGASGSMLAFMRRNRRRYDVAHAHNYHALPALTAAISGLRPIVFTPHFHGGGHSGAARLAHIAYRPLTRVLFAACTTIACVSRAEADRFTSSFPGTASKVTVVQNGVAVGIFRAAESYDLPNDIVLAAGRLEDYKQFDRILLASEFLDPGDQVVLLGDGVGRASIDRLSQSRALSQRVRVLGRVPDQALHRWFRSASAVVSMSLHESFGLTLVEALAAGAPVVASDIPAHREISAEQPAGAVRLVAPHASPREIASAIRESKSQGLPAGVRIRTWREVVDDFERIYRSASADSRND